MALTEFESLYTISSNFHYVALLTMIKFVFVMTKKVFYQFLIKIPIEILAPMKYYQWCLIEMMARSENSPTSLALVQCV